MYEAIMNNNQFQQYTDKLAKILKTKNDAYGNSFDKSLDADGLLVAKIRMGDKLNRFNNLIKHPEIKKNDEALADTVLDLAGYALLTYKYMKARK